MIPGSGRSPRRGIGYPLQYSWASLAAQMVKNPPAMQETWVEKIPRRREKLPTSVFWPGEFHGLYSSWGSKELDTTERLSLSGSSPALWQESLKSLTQHSGTEHQLPVVINWPWPPALITILTFFFFYGCVGLCCFTDFPLVWHPGLSLQWLQ